MENRRTFARLLSHMLPFLPVAHGKACGCCRAGRGSRRQTRKEVRNQSVSSVRIASLNDALPNDTRKPSDLLTDSSLNVRQYALTSISALP